MFVSSRARIIAWESHRPIRNREEWFCLCGERNTVWLTGIPGYWQQWDKHFVAKAEEVQQVLTPRKGTP